MLLDDDIKLIVEADDVFEDTAVFYESLRVARVLILYQYSCSERKRSGFGLGSRVLLGYLVAWYCGPSALVKILLLVVL